MKKWVVSIVVLCLFGILTALFFSKDEPVLFQLSEPGDPLGPVFTVFHPFRDKGPERAVDRLLNGLRSGEIDRALAATGLSSDRRAYLRDQETAHKLRGWRLVEREDGDLAVDLSYECTRVGSSSTSHLKVVVVEIDGAKGLVWQVQTFNPWY
jgi:hypothetical protein